MEAFGRKFNNWFSKNISGFLVFNFVLMILILLHTAGYFDPYLPLTINLIIFVSMVLSIFLFSFRSRALFTLCLFFLGLALVFRTLNIDPWSDRTGIYVFQSFLLGVILLYFEK